MTTNEQKIEKLSKKKYTKLTAGNLMWRSDDGFNLSTLGEQLGYCETNTIPAEAYSAVKKAVNDGILEFTNSPKKASAEKVEQRKPPVSDSTGSFEWTEKPDPKKAMKSPSFTGRTLGYKSESALEKQAFKLLADTSAKAVDSFTKVFSTIDKKDEKIQLVKAAYKIERGGHNPAMGPRAAVIDYLTDIMIDLGIKNGLSGVVEERESIVTDSKPVRFAM